MADKIADTLLLVRAKIRIPPLTDNFLEAYFRWVPACFTLIVLLVWLFDSTDVPYIKSIPSIPGLPIVGNLIQLGTEQPRRFANLSKKYGPVFQVRLGNKVRSTRTEDSGVASDPLTAICSCEQLRIYQATLDQQPV